MRLLLKMIWTSRRRGFRSIFRVTTSLRRMERCGRGGRWVDRLRPSRRIAQNRKEVASSQTHHPFCTQRNTPNLKPATLDYRFIWYIICRIPTVWVKSLFIDTLDPSRQPGGSQLSIHFHDAMTEPVTFSFEELGKTYTSDPNFEPKIIEIFGKYLKPDDGLTLTQTAEFIVSLLPEATEWSSELETFWHLCLDVALQIPHYHAFHLKLVRLILALRHSPKTSFIVVSVRFQNQGFPRGRSDTDNKIGQRDGPAVRAGAQFIWANLA